MSIPRLHAEGLLFIGDPHQSSRAPGRRIDDCFYRTVSNKIAQAMRIAEDRKLIPVFLGDFFDRDDDTDAAMLVSTIQALKTTGHTPWTLVGNHEKKRTTLTNDTALSVLISAGCLIRFPDNGAAFLLESPAVGGGTQTVGVGGTGYDQTVPFDVRPFFLEEHVDVVWLTHHDWAFEGSYPNASRPHQIEGCSLVVNGHIHLEKPSKRVGQTLYTNPGNITRMSIDAHNHVPRVWVYRPGQVKLHPIPLEFKKDQFDWTGKVASAILADAPVKDVSTSAFVALMAQEIDNAEHATQDGSKFLERMSAFCAEQKMPVEVQDHLARLFEAVRHDQKPT
jgi:hypothetical protein